MNQEELSQALYHKPSKDTNTDNVRHLQKHLALVQLLKSWDEEDEKEDEQELYDTWEQLKQALDQDRLSNRKLFPINTIVLLDTGVLGLLTNSKAALAGNQCSQWLITISSKGLEIRVPEIADYEIRRELLRIDKAKGIKRLDELKDVLGYIPLTTQTMLIAAQ